MGSSQRLRAPVLGKPQSGEVRAVLGKTFCALSAAIVSIVIVNGSALARSGPAPQLAAVAPALNPEALRASTPDKTQMGPSGLPVPRWVSIKSSRVNVRQGPSTDHAVLWTYVREGQPVEVIAEFDTWRRIRDQSGEVGWVKQQMISGKRTVVFTGPGNVAILSAPGNPEGVVAYATPGLVASLQACKGHWCAIEARGYDGFVPRASLWGVYRGE
jgi:SH3-like domain-containing protein